jgi:hypothetical protein
MWHSFIDVHAVVNENLNNCVEDVLWYVVKMHDNDYENIEHWTDKELKTHVATWYFGLHSYSLSGEFETDLSILFKVIKTETIQLDLEGNVKTIITYEFIGMISGKVIKIDGKIWFKRYDKPPDWLMLCWMPSRIQKCVGVGLGLGMGFK